MRPPPELKQRPAEDHREVGRFFQVRFVGSGPGCVHKLCVSGIDQRRTEATARTLFLCFPGLPRLNLNFHFSRIPWAGRENALVRALTALHDAVVRKSEPSLVLLLHLSST